MNMMSYFPYICETKKCKESNPHKKLQSASKGSETLHLIHQYVSCKVRLPCCCFVDCVSVSRKNFKNVIKPTGNGKAAIPSSILSITPEVENEAVTVGSNFN